MDPNETLRRIRVALATIASQETPPAIARATALEMSLDVEALDGWLQRGGALPDAWTKRTPVMAQRWAVRCLGLKHRTIFDTRSVAERYAQRRAENAGGSVYVVEPVP